MDDSAAGMTDAISNQQFDAAVHEREGHQSTYSQVAASPSRTSDGILYSGKKVDTWVSVSRLSGEKKGALSYEGCLRYIALKALSP